MDVEGYQKHMWHCAMSIVITSGVSTKLDLAAVIWYGMLGILSENIFI